MDSNVLIRERTLEWQRRSTMRLTELVRFNIKGRESAKSLRETRSIFQGIIIDMMNGGDQRNGIVNAIRLISNRMKLDRKDVEKCLEWPSDYEVPDFEKKFHHDRGSDRSVFKVEFDIDRKISIELPITRYDEIMERGLSEERMIHFVERYSFLSPELGFFWSVHPEGYEIIRSRKDQNTHRVIEGFASPLNHNLEEWCAAYESDKELGSLGTFQNVIRSTVTPEGKSIRWTVNPAYTDLLLDISHREVMARMEKYPEDEFFMLLPGWHDPPIIEFLVKNGECWFLEGGTYRVYDHLAGQTVNVPKSIGMFIGYVRSKDATLPVVPFVKDVVDASYLGKGPRPKMITMDDIRISSAINKKL